MKLDKSKKYIKHGEVYRWNEQADMWVATNGRRAYCHELFQEYASYGKIQVKLEPIEFDLVIFDDGAVFMSCDTEHSRTNPNIAPLVLRGKKFKCVEVQS